MPTFKNNFIYLSLIWHQLTSPPVLVIRIVVVGNNWINAGSPKSRSWEAASRSFMESSVHALIFVKWFFFCPFQCVPSPVLRHHKGSPNQTRPLAPLHCKKRFMVANKGGNHASYRVINFGLCVRHLEQPPQALGLKCLYSLPIGKQSMSHICTVGVELWGRLVQSVLSSKPDVDVCYGAAIFGKSGSQVLKAVHLCNPYISALPMPLIVTLLLSGLAPFYMFELSTGACHQIDVKCRM